jgi:hypothetical protein
MTDRKLNCPQCGKQFTPWRGKTYCSEACRKRAENIRAGRIRGDETDSEAMIPDAENPKKNDEQNQALARGRRGDEEAQWIAVNEVTDKFARKGGDAVGWTMLIEGKGWYGRVGKHMSFGPTTRTRARAAVEAFLRGEPFEKRGGEQSWRGDCMGVLPSPSRETGKVASMVNPTIEAIRRELADGSIDEAIDVIARRMRVAPTAVREALK